MNCLLSGLLIKLFPKQQETLELVKKGEERLSLYWNPKDQLCQGGCDDRTIDPPLDKNKDLQEIIRTYFDPAIKICPNLQLPYIIRAKALAELSLFEEAKQDSRIAHRLNLYNRRGIATEKLVVWRQRMHESHLHMLATCAISALIHSNDNIEDSDVHNAVKEAAQDLRKEMELGRCYDTSAFYPESSKYLQLSDHGIDSGDIECQLCLVKIKRHEQLTRDYVSTEEGDLPRYMLETQGVYRFKINALEQTTAGYYTATVDRIEDVEPEDANPDWDPSELEALCLKAREQELIDSAIRFLSDPKVQEAPLDKRVSFLESKGLTKAEIDSALSQVKTGGPPALPNKPQTIVVQQQTTSWKDITIGLIGVAGVGYGAVYLAKQYLGPYLNFQTAEKIQADTDEIQKQLQGSQKLIESADKQTKDIIAGMESHAKEVSSSLAEMSNLLNTLMQADKDKQQEIDVIKSEMKELKETFPTLVEKTREGQKLVLEEVQAEIKSLKNLLLNKSLKDVPGSESPSFSFGKPSIPAWQLAKKDEEKVKEETSTASIE
ncbi:peroxisomal membrane protein pex14 [Terramyces sp. JEL0728]|nr:peroxisomal membrane protein pex14 [Terramyces sp. JEL0728]